MRQLPHNEFEAVIAQFLLANGSDIHFNGWPDLLVKHNNRIFAVEAKRGNDFVRPNQKAVHDVFAKAAIRLMVARTSPKTIVDKFKQWVREQAAVPVNPLETFVRAMESPQPIEGPNGEIRTDRQEI